MTLFLLLISQSSSLHFHTEDELEQSACDHCRAGSAATIDQWAFVVQPAVWNELRRAARLALHPRDQPVLLLRPSKVGNARMDNYHVAFAASTLVVPHILRRLAVGSESSARMV